MLDFEKLGPKSKHRIQSPQQINLASLESARKLPNSVFIMGVKYASVKQDTDDATPVQWAGDAQVLRKYKFWLQLFALIAAFSVIWNLYLFSILAGIKEASDELYPEVIPYSKSSLICAS